MNITVIGTGYVGLVTGACLAEMGNCVHCVDIDERKIDQLKNGIMPIYEPGLETMVKKNHADNRLHFITTLRDQLVQPTFYFIAVGTPSDIDGAADLQYVLNVAHTIGQTINDYTVIINKSTVPVGTADLVKHAILEELQKRNLSIPFDVASNPEFLREGNAINDFMRPDRIIIGYESDKAKTIIKELYAPFTQNNEHIIFMGIRESEMTKYTANAFLAMKISFMNEIAIICDQLGADVERVRRGIGSDHRIGYDFTYPGCGYGGSCFPKDVKALIHLAEKNKVDPKILKSVELRNAEQKHVLAQKLMSRFGEDLSAIKIGVWGLSFKPETDDMRDASSKIFLEDVIIRGATVKAFDPIAMPSAKKELPEKWFTQKSLQLVEKQEEVLKDADVLVLITEWNHFRNPNFMTIKQHMRGNLIIDGRNQYNPIYLRSLGFEYMGIGR